MPSDVTGSGPENPEPKPKPSTQKAGARAGDAGKNIVLCSDGTGNSGGKGRGTNVWAIVNAVWRQPDAGGKLPARTQVTFYDDGVGTRQFFLFKLLGGAFGWGYSRNIRDLYKALAWAYRPDDSIYLFGFSRGAYTVRALAGLIVKRGILDPRAFKSSAELDFAVRAVYAAYRDLHGSILGTLRRLLRPDYTRAYKRYCANGQIHDLAPDGAGITTPIQFIGVWDTVDAVGMPVDEIADFLNLFVRFRFPDNSLHENVRRACHAVSIDDERKTFDPVMWTQTSTRNGEETPDDRIEQVWFPGVHSNVGGGYPKNQMAEVALDWMMQKAEQSGLQFYADFKAKVRESANAHGHLYDSRAGLAAYYRYRPRNIARICQQAKIAEPLVHLSALRRAGRATAGYAPANVPGQVTVVGTHAQDTALVGRIQTAVGQTTQDRTAGSRRVARYVAARRILYYLFLAYSGAIAGAAVWFRWFAPPVRLPAAEPPVVVGYLVDGIAWILPDFLHGFLEPLLAYARAQWHNTVIAVVVLVLFVVAKYLLERKARQLALDSWRTFRHLVYP